jgi:hypothetical protein
MPTQGVKGEDLNLHSISLKLDSLFHLYTVLITNLFCLPQALKEEIKDMHGLRIHTSVPP